MEPRLDSERDARESVGSRPDGMTRRPGHKCGIRTASVAFGLVPRTDLTSARTPILCTLAEACRARPLGACFADHVSKLRVSVSLRMTEREEEVAASSMYHAVVWLWQLLLLSGTGFKMGSATHTYNGNS
eukprot:6197536-Pleurochrysis_carterae.AAC.4